MFNLPAIQVPAPMPMGNEGQNIAPPQDEKPPVPPMSIIAPPKPNKNQWDVNIVQRAQGIYPSEANAKAAQIAQAKQPTPTGAWGKPQ
jgi:hypothetical protein